MADPRHRRRERGGGAVGGGLWRERERTGQPPTARELDNVARALTAAAAHAKPLGLSPGIEPLNRYGSHLITTGRGAAAMIARIGAENLFAHLDTYRMNIGENGVARGILDARKHLRYLALSESHRGATGACAVQWDEVFATLRAIGFKGGLAMESFINMPPEIACTLSVWRPVASAEAEVMETGLPFLRNKARRYGLIRTLLTRPPEGRPLRRPASAQIPEIAWISEFSVTSPAVKVRMTRPEYIATIRSETCSTSGISELMTITA